MKEIVFEKEQIHLGSFLTPEEAAIAYNQASLKYYGPNGYINVIKHENASTNG